MLRQDVSAAARSPVSRPVSLAAALLLGLAAAGGAFAHHGFGNFDRSKELTLKGSVTKIDFVNPHAYVYFSVPGTDGKETPYRCEMRAATVLRRSGWSAEMFKSGEPIEVTGAPDRFDAHSCYVSTIVFADGTTADRYAQLKKPGDASSAPAVARAARLPSGEPNITGDWAPEQVVMTDPRGISGALVPVSQVGNFKPGEQRPPPRAGGNGGFGPRVEYTPAGKQAADAFRNFSSEDNPRLRCETTSVLFDWTFDGPVNRITQSGDTITLQYGQLGFTRTIHMNAEHPAAFAQRTRAGHSTGRWENDVLVVDTVGFAPGVLNPPIMNSEQLHVVERFAFDPATMKITRSYTATDPVYFTSEYTGTDTIGVADLPYAPDECHELTFDDFSNDGTAPGRAASTPLPGAAGAPAQGGAQAATQGGAQPATAPAGAAPGAAPSTAAEKPAAPAKSWWKFWEWWD